MTFYVTSNLHEQFFVCDNFYLSHKSASFSATVFATQKLPNFPRLHGQIKIVTSKLSHKNCSCKRGLSAGHFLTIQGVSKKTLRKFNRLSCIINVAKQFNFYIGRKDSYLAFQ